MTKEERVEYQKQGAPSGLPEGAPRGNYPSHDWLIQLMMEVQNTLGKVEQAVNDLSTRFEKQEKKLDSVSHKVYAAQVIGAIILALSSIGLIFLSKIWDAIVSLLQLKPHL